MIMERFDVHELDEAIVTRLEKDTQAILYFFFRKNAKIPFLAVKMSSHKSNNEALAKEYDNLTRVRNILSGRMRTSIPETYVSGMLQEHFYFVQEFINGNLLEDDFRENPYSDIIFRIRLVWEWLMDFQAAGSRGDKKCDDFQFEHLIKLYQNAYDPGSKERVYINELIESLQNLEGHNIPVVSCHGDFFPGNIITKENKVFVIDWQYFKETYHPVFDITIFLATFRSSAIRGNEENNVEENFRVLFSQENASSAYFLEAVREYIQNVGLAPYLFLTLFELSLLECATREYSYFGSVTEKDEAWRKRFLFYLDNKESIIFNKLKV
jgi:thiamine kinase-like enzyme